MVSNVVVVSLAGMLTSGSSDRYPKVCPKKGSENKQDSQTGGDQEPAEESDRQGSENGQDSQTGGDQEPAEESDRQGSESRQDSQTGGGSITGR